MSGFSTYNAMPIQMQETVPAIQSSKDSHSPSQPPKPCKRGGMTSRRTSGRNNARHQMILDSVIEKKESVPLTAFAVPARVFYENESCVVINVEIECDLT